MSRAKTMILAAGKGTRMGALGQRMPKPLVPVAGRALIDRSLDQIEKADMGPTVINIHHLAPQMEKHLAPYVMSGSVLVSHERDELLETGGGIARARSHFGDRVLAINGDALWLDHHDPGALRRLWQAFDPDCMDILLLAVHLRDATGYDGPGDLIAQNAFDNDVPQMVTLNPEANPTDYLYGGLMVARSALYEDAPVGPWSNKRLFIQAAEQGRLYAILHDGLWMHVGCPEGLREAEKQLARQKLVL